MTNAQGQPTVLLVDDDDDFLFQQRLQLEAAGLRVVTAENQAQAREVFAQSKPDLAVVDVMMEHPDAGFTFCHWVRKQVPKVPVILVTSVNSETGLDFAMATEEERSWIQADAMLAKPIRFEQLKQEIDRLLGVKEEE